MKKKHAILFGSTAMLTLALAGSVGAVAASADTDLGPSSTTTTVEITYNVADSWKVTIPASITIGEAAKISATDVYIADGSTLKVTLKGVDESGWKLKEASTSKTIDYTVKKGDEQNTQETTVNVNDSILEVTGGETKKDSYIKAEVEGNKSTGGKDYKDTLTFTATVA